MSILLTIAIPTYNRSSYLSVCLESVCGQLDCFRDYIEVVVSDNCSTDNSADVVSSFIEAGYDINYVKNATNIGFERNFLQCFNLSSGKYLLLLGDDDVLLPGALTKIMTQLIDDDFGVVYLKSYAFESDPSLSPKKKKIAKSAIRIYNDSDQFISDINIMLTFISGNIFNKNLISKEIDYDSFLGSGIIQFYWYISAILNAEKNLYIDDYCIAGKCENSGGYSICKVFGCNLVDALNFFGKVGLSKNVIKKFEKIILVDFLPIFILRQKKVADNFHRDDYYSLLVKVNNRNLFFWFVTVPVIRLPVSLGGFWHRKSSKLVKIFDKLFNRKVIKNKRENGFFLKLKGKFDKKVRKVHNFFLAQSIRKFQGRPIRHLSIHPSAKISGLAYIKFGDNFTAGEHLRLDAVSRFGDYWYAPEIVIKNNVCLNDFVHIGAVNYVEIGNDVLMASKIFISDHNHGTYSGLIQSDPDEVPSMRRLTCNKKVIIGDRVWIGEFVSILPGVTIGEGSIIAANSVVTRDVPSNCIVAGAPARVVKSFNADSMQWRGTSVAG